MKTNIFNFCLYLVFTFHLGETLKCQMQLIKHNNTNLSLCFDFSMFYDGLNVTSGVTDKITNI